MTAIDRLVRKEVALGAIREMQPPEQYIGLQIAPFLDVASDDVIFDYIKGGLQDGLAPARAEDAEAELAQKDQLLYGAGRAALIDWSLKTKYTASDVTRYREDLAIQEQLQGAGVQLNLNYNGRAAAEFQAKLARDDRNRKRRLDNRIEWLITQGFATGQIAYNDGKIKFSVNYGRPGDQQDIAPDVLWEATNKATMDPIGDIKAALDLIENRTGVRPSRGVLSRKVVERMWLADRFLAAMGMPVIPGGTTNVPLDPNYILQGYSPEAALRIVEQATGVSFTIYDGFYQTRPLGSATYTNNRFIADDKIILYPGEGQLGEIDDTEIGFAKTLTSPHPEGNWTPGFYEWEDESKDPWLHVRGSGVKAFPVFPYLQYTAVLDVF